MSCVRSLKRTVKSSATTVAHPDAAAAAADVPVAKPADPEKNETAGSASESFPGRFVVQPSLLALI